MAQSKLTLTHSSWQHKIPRSFLFVVQSKLSSKGHSGKNSCTHRLFWRVISILSDENVFFRAAFSPASHTNIEKRFLQSLNTNKPNWVWWRSYGESPLGDQGVCVRDKKDFLNHTDYTFQRLFLWNGHLWVSLSTAGNITKDTILLHKRSSSFTWKYAVHCSFLLKKGRCWHTPHSMFLKRPRKVHFAAFTLTAVKPTSAQPWCKMHNFFAVHVNGISNTKNIKQCITQNRQGSIIPSNYGPVLFSLDSSICLCDINTSFSTTWLISSFGVREVLLVISLCNASAAFELLQSATQVKHVFNISYQVNHTISS